ncbi:multicopper oxidase-domain-containing protein [Zychaea mexicana]|uniref:multicopper oxidase-domain-containing protein n=1 Tax=Zychaea mexicana TaxID=64656 RepID=UPI0022FDFFD3|nr:multicopper oxidase-domain-containing protein [Zychaea mexicana]KAI9491562.1 multicopper oxidase-domain-containing protein [Zychaea mexicana]
MYLLKSFGAASLLAATVANAAQVVLNWDITYTNANPDGLQERRVIGVNGQWPPPPVEATINDTLVINVHNSLDVPTAVHSHGMFQNNTAYMDGPSMVTQCPIPPGHDFTYEFNITQHGTYWIHSHYMGQYMDGFRTPLILHNTVETYQYDYDRTVTLVDWYHAESTEGLATFLNEYNPTGAEPIPDSGLIMDNANASLTFTPGKTYRLRLINMSGFVTYHYSIDNHTLDVIEVDGVEVQRQPMDMVSLTAAQRVSVLVTAKNDTSMNYYMHADMDTEMLDSLPDTLQYNISIPIFYDQTHTNFGAIQNIAFNNTSFDDTILQPVEVLAAVEPDVSINLEINFDVTTDGINRGMFNDLPYLPPKVPTLNTLFSEGQYPLSSEVYGPQTGVHILKHLDMVQLVLNNKDGNDHPFHLHGHVFQVVGRGDGYYDNNSSITLNTTNPMRRDTIRVPGEGYTIIRFRADNPGVWFFHCHIEWHLESGLAVTLVEAPDVAQQRMTLPSSMSEMCTAGGIPATGNAAGKKGLDLSGAPSGVTLIYDGFTARGKGAMAGCIIAALLGIATIVWFAHADPQKEARAIVESKHMQ